jgi:hypothetical protein
MQGESSVAGSFLQRFIDTFKESHKEDAKSYIFAD